MEILDDELVTTNWVDPEELDLSQPIKFLFPIPPNNKHLTSKFTVLNQRAQLIHFHKNMSSYIDYVEDVQRFTEPRRTVRTIYLISKNGDRRKLYTGTQFAKNPRWIENYFDHSGVPKIGPSDVYEKMMDSLTVHKTTYQDNYTLIKEEYTSFRVDVPDKYITMYGLCTPERVCLLKDHETWYSMFILRSVSAHKIHPDIIKKLFVYIVQLGIEPEEIFMTQASYRDLFLTGIYRQITELTKVA